jgi:hypothetical protein
MFDFGSSSSQTFVNHVSAPVDEPKQAINSHTVISLPIPTTLTVQTPSSPTVNTVRAEFGNLNSEALLNFISSRTTADIAPSIAGHLQRHVSKGHVTDIRATMIQPFTPNYAPWPLFAWKEGDDTEVMAIFKISSPDTPGSCLLHYGVGRCWREQGKRWTRSYISWAVEHIEHMAELFVAAWHVSGIMQPLNIDMRAIEKSHTKDEYIFLIDFC